MEQALPHALAKAEGGEEMKFSDSEPEKEGDDDDKEEKDGEANEETEA